ncbi:MAG: polysaccharide deacetylase family protein [Bradyrhizobium sp.]
MVAKVGEGDIVKHAATPPQPGTGQLFAESVRNGPVLSGTVRRVRLPPGRKLVALTFDLCEAPHETAGYQGEIVDILRAHGIKATFFLVGKWMMTHQARAQQLMSDGRFEVGNHTFAHHNLRLLSGAAAKEEISSTDQVYRRLREQLAARKCIPPAQPGYADETTPGSMGLFRFPYGACNPQSLAAVSELGLIPIQWDVSSDDPDYRQPPDAMTRMVLDNVRPGSIVLFHANGRGWYTDDALPGIISGLQERGYQFVTVTELLKAGDPVISPSCYDRTDGDTDRYDDLARQLEEQ